MIALAKLLLILTKHWPFYQDWCTVFGKDRANGEERTTVADAIHEICEKDKGKAPVSPAMAASNATDSPSAPSQSDADSTMQPRSRGETETSPNKSGRAGKKGQGCKMEWRLMW